MSKACVYIHKAHNEGLWPQITKTYLACHASCHTQLRQSWENKDIRKSLLHPIPNQLSRPVLRGMPKCKNKMKIVLIVEGVSWYGMARAHKSSTGNTARTGMQRPPVMLYVCLSHVTCLMPRPHMHVPASHVLPQCEHACHVLPHAPHAMHNHVSTTQGRGGEGEGCAGWPCGRWRWQVVRREGWRVGEGWHDWNMGEGVVVAAYRRVGTWVWKGNV